MEVLPSNRESESDSAKHDRIKEAKEFHKTKAGVKGLVDSGLERIPKMFVHKEATSHSPTTVPNNISNNLEVPLIDFLEIGRGQWTELVHQIRRASETWGFFMVLPRLIPEILMDEVLRCQKEFHEQSAEMKKKFYSIDEKKSVRFYSNGGFEDSEPAEWRDSLEINIPDRKVHTEAIPEFCRYQFSFLFVNFFWLIAEYSLGKMTAWGLFYRFYYDFYKTKI